MQGCSKYPDLVKPPPDWPSKGQIKPKGLTYRHSPEGPLVLKGITATILPSEMVSISALVLIDIGILRLA